MDILYIQVLFRTFINMFIIHIITSTDVGGAEKSLLRLVTEFDRRGVSQLVISLKRPGVIAKSILGLGVPVLSFRADFFNIINIFYKVSKDQNSIIQSWMYHSDFIGSIFSVFFRIKIVWNIRQTSFSIGDPLLTKVIMKLCACLSSFIPERVICVANSAAVNHIRCGYSKKKIVIIPNGYEIKDFIPLNKVDSLRSSLNVTKENILVGIVGRFHVAKDIVTFVSMAKELLRNDKKFVFIMIGMGFDQNNLRLLSLLDEMNVTNSFRLVGIQENTNEYYSIMNIFCLTSVTEGFPNVLVEAMLNGVPVFSTKCGDAHIILNNDQFLSEIRDYKSLANKIISFIQKSKEEQLSLIKSNREIAIERYSISAVTNVYLELYNRVLLCVD